MPRPYLGRWHAETDSQDRKRQAGPYRSTMRPSKRSMQRFGELCVDYEVLRTIDQLFSAFDSTPWPTTEVQKLGSVEHSLRPTTPAST